MPFRNLNKYKTQIDSEKREEKNYKYIFSLFNTEKKVQ